MQTNNIACCMEQRSGSIKQLKGTSESQDKDWVSGEAVTKTGKGSVNSVVCFLSFLNTGSVGLAGTNVKAGLPTENLYRSFSNSS